MTEAQKNYLKRHPEDVQYSWFVKDLEPEIKRQLQARSIGIYYESYIDFEEQELNKYYDFKNMASIEMLAAMAINFMKQQSKKN